MRRALDNNALSGTIPPELGNLVSLEVLYALPAPLACLNTVATLLHRREAPCREMAVFPRGNLLVARGANVSCTSLRLRMPMRRALHNNALSGTIPADLGNLTSLYWLYALPTVQCHHLLLLLGGAWHSAPSLVASVRGLTCLANRL